ncbi:hypothetical protein PFISCL1PPCAC_2250, partial [Pristionchus fissidentatus]
LSGQIGWLGLASAMASLFLPPKPQSVIPPGGKPSGKDRRHLPSVKVKERRRMDEKRRRRIESNSSTNHTQATTETIMKWK